MSISSFILSTSELFNYKLVILHLNIVFISSMVVYMILFLLWKLNIFNKLTQLVISILLTSYLHILLLFYVLLFVAEYGWGELPTFELVYIYVKNLKSVLDSLPFENLVLCFASISYLSLLLLTYVLIKKYIVKNFIESFSYKSTPETSHFCKKVILLTIIITSSTSLFILRFNSLVSHSEPIYIFIYGTSYQGKISKPMSPLKVKLNIDYINDIKSNSKNLKKNIILIVVDALKADNMSVYGYHRDTTPFLNQLYKNGDIKKVENVFSTSASSFAGITSILSSSTWENTHSNNIKIGDILLQYGYTNNYILSGDFTNFYKLKKFLGNDISYYTDGTSTKKFSPNDDRQIFEKIDNFLIKNKKPSFIYFHLMSAHFAGNIDTQYNKYTPYKVGLLGNTNEQSMRYTNNYDNGILQSDDSIKKIFTYLKKYDYLKNSIVIVTADHGEALGEKGEFGHGKNMYNYQIKIPLLIYGLDDNISIKAPYATQPDIMASVLEILNIPAPQTWNGESLFDETLLKASYHQEHDNYYVVIQYTENYFYKYIYNKREQTEEIFDMKRDIKETTNIINDVNKSIVLEFRKLAEEAFKIKDKHE